MSRTYRKGCEVTINVKCKPPLWLDTEIILSGLFRYYENQLCFYKFTHKETKGTRKVIEKYTFYYMNNDLQKATHSIQKVVAKIESISDIIQLEGIQIEPAEMWMETIYDCSTQPSAMGALQSLAGQLPQLITRKLSSVFKRTRQG